MDNQTDNTENAWVDSKLSALGLPADWHPNSKRAYSEFLKRRDSNEPESSSGWLRLSMAAAILASIGLVLTLLPWNSLWKPAVKKNAEVRLTMPRSVKAQSPIAVPEPLKSSTPPASRPQPSFSQPALSQPKMSQPALSQPALSQPALSQPALSQPALSQPPTQAPGTGQGISQTALTVQDPEQKPAERVGNGVSPPRAIQPTAEPEYTDDARKAHIQGAVTLAVIIHVDGTGKVVKVVRSLGYGLDEKAIEAFEKWRFEPGKKDGMPVNVEVQVVINFRLY